MSGGRPPDSWRHLASLVDRLIDAEPDQRAGLIAELSGGDLARRSELERLVADLERDAPLLDRPAADRFAALFDAQHSRFPEGLAERYRPVRDIGRGGMAAVYLARDLKHGRDVAVKVIHPALALALGTGQFLREIEIAARLHHPHIVPLYDSGEADGSLYYVMPYEPGPSLRQRLVLDGPLPVDDAVLILRDVCDALAYAHRHGIVHRDIKPDNILLSGRHALVTDFGVAKALAATGQPSEHMELERDTSSARVTIASAVLGTPTYMAPEQIARDPHIDHRADIYSLGVLAYELLTGRPPFSGETREELLSAHLSAAPAPLTMYRSDVPAPLAALTMTCLAKRAADRCQSADELLHRLERLAVRRDDTWRNRWANARVERLTDFTGSEVDAAISSDGRFVAFLSDRDGAFDAFVTQVGSGEFLNLTGGRFPELFNEDVRNIGFSADGSHVSLRVADITSPASIWLGPTLGGPLRPFLDSAVMAAWSPDGSKIAYHEATPGDPIYVTDREGRDAHRVFIADPGVHNHHLSWSPDGQFLYFAHGLPPNNMDVWRIRVGTTAPERVTSHGSRVGHPVQLDERTLLYTASADDGSGPWLYSMDLEDRVAQRVNMTVEHYISIAASDEVRGQPRRLVATVSNPSVNVWSVPITTGLATEDAAIRIPLPTARSAAPRFRPDGSLLYLASRGGANGVWQLSGDRATEIWKAAEGAVVGAPAVSPDGSMACFPVRRRGRSTLYCMATDGNRARPLAESLDVRGGGSWSPDGNWIAVAAADGPSTRVFTIPVAGGPAVRLVDSVSSDPVWSPDGTFIVYSGISLGRSVPVNAVTPHGEPYPVAPISVDRVSDSYRFLPGGKELVVKLGGFRRQDFWAFDVSTGDRRQLTKLRPGDSLRRFDVSPDGKQIVFERVRENSDIVLIELPRI